MTPHSGPGSDSPAPVIEARALAKTYGGSPAVHALRPVDLTVRQADCLAIVGPSGSGKSTLLNLLGLLDRPAAGSYLLTGIDTARLSEAQRAGLRGQRIGFVFQAFHLLPHRTAAENVALAQVYARRGRAERRALLFFDGTPACPDRGT